MNKISNQLSNASNPSDYCNNFTSIHSAGPLKLLSVLQQARIFNFLSLFLTLFTLSFFANPININAKATVDDNPYTVSFINAVENNNNTTTFSYSVKFIDDDRRGNGLSHIIFGLGPCLKFKDVLSATIDGNPYSDLKGKEGNGTGCDVPDNTSILKFDNLPDGFKDGDPHIFSFTVAGIIDVVDNSTSWVKAGKNCYPVYYIKGPGCPKPNPCDLKLDLKAPPIACYGGKTTITATASGSNATLEYSFDGGTTYHSSNMLEVVAGTYKVCVREVNRKDCSKCNEIKIEEGKPINFYHHYEPIACYGGTTKLVIYNPTGGSGSYEYSFDGGLTYGSSNEKVVPAGTYNVCVRDAITHKCYECKPVEIKQPAPISITPYYEPIKCYGGTTTLTVTASGGTAPYEYSINGGAYQSSNVFPGLTAGTYNVCVRDYRGCVQCKEVIIGQPAPISITPYYEPIKCYGGTTTLTVTASGGTAPYEYSINGGAYQSSNVFPGLTAGTYNVCVRDYRGCVQCKEVIIGQPAPISITPYYEPIKCYGGTTTLTVTASGGTAPYEYSINGGAYQSSNVFPGLTAGTYNVCIRDYRGCVQCKEVIIGQPAPISITPYYEPIKCYGGTTTLTVTASGGTAPYEYSINGGAYQSSNVFPGLTAGTYNVCIRDYRGCVQCKEVIIGQPAPISITPYYEPIKCYGGTTTLTVTASGGTAPYEYSINGGAYQSSNVFPGLTAGTYNVCIRDYRGCVQCKEVIIGQPAPISITPYYEPIKCYGGTTTLTVTASGGTAPYEYSINGGAYQSSNVFPGLTAGTYNVCVRDYRGCVQCKEVIIGQPAPISITPYYEPIKCYGGTTTLTVTASGGTAPYEYSINGGAYQSSNVFPGLTAGTYNVCVRDYRGCVQCKEVIIGQPAPISITPYYEPIKCYGGTTTLTVTASGGTAPYEYSINGGAYQSSNVFPGLTAGTYTVCVKDKYGCVYCKTVKIQQPKPIVIKPKYNNIKYYGGTTKLEIKVNGGTAPYMYSINNGRTYQYSNIFKKVKAGTYWVCVKDIYGCVNCIKVVIKGPGCNCYGRETDKPVARLDVSDQQVITTEVKAHLNVYPNPFQGEANIEFTLPKEGAYSLDMYDAKGALVKRIQSGNAKAGILQRSKLDNDVPSGIYMIILNSGDGKRTFRVRRQ